MALRDEIFFDLDVVLNDAVMDHDYLVVAICVGMGVEVCGGAVSCPPSMPDSRDALREGTSQRRGEVDQLSRLFVHCGNSIGIEHGDSRAVVASIFEGGESLKNYWSRLAGSCVADYSTHIRLSRYRDQLIQSVDSKRR